MSLEDQYEVARRRNANLPDNLSLAPRERPDEMSAEKAATYRAVCYDEDGYVMSEQEIAEWVEAWRDGDEDYKPAPEEIAVVTGSAMPKRESEYAEKGPGSYQALDVIAEWDLLMGTEGDEVAPRWEMAKKIAEALNG